MPLKNFIIIILRHSRQRNGLEKKVLFLLRAGSRSVRKKKKLFLEIHTKALLAGPLSLFNLVFMIERECERRQKRKLRWCFRNLIVLSKKRLNIKSAIFDVIIAGVIFFANNILRYQLSSSPRTSFLWPSVKIEARISRVFIIKALMDALM